MSAQSTEPATGRRTGGKTAPGAHVPGDVERAARRDISLIAKRDAQLAESSLAESLIVLARELDSPKNSATSKSMCARALREGLDRLRELAPETSKDSPLQEIRKRRDKRLLRP